MLGIGSRKFFVVAVFVLLFCNFVHEKEYALATTISFETFRDIPEITNEQILAIENILLQHDYFIYGMTSNAEAFIVDGEVLGFARHMTDWLSGLFGIPFVPYIFELPEIFDGLEDGSIHFTGQLTRLPERELIYRMTSPIVSRQLMTVRLEESEPLTEIETPRFVFLAGTVTRQVLYDTNAIDFYGLYAETFDEIAELLLNGEVDAFIGDLAQTIQITDSNPMFVTNQLYPFVIRTASFSAQNEELFPIVDVVQLAMDNGGMAILGGIYARGAEEFNRNRFLQMLSPAELDFVRSNPVIHIGAHSYGYPVSFFNDHEQMFQGLGIDILRQLEILTGMEFHIVHDASPSLSLDDMLYAGEISLAVGTVHSHYVDNRDFLWSTPIFTDNYALISHSDFPSIVMGEVLYNRVGLIRNTTYEQIFTSWFGNYMNVNKDFTTMPAMLDALDNNEIDLIFSSHASILSTINYYERMGFRVNILFEETYNVSFALCSNEEALLSILNKALTLVPIDFISDYWTTRTFDYNARIMEMQLQSDAQALQWQMTLVIVVIVLICMTMLLLYIRTMHERKQLSQLVAERTQSLEEETATLNAIFDLIPDVLFCKDLEFKHTRINKHFIELFGLTREEILGKTEHEFANLPKEIMSDWRKVDTKVMSEHKVYRVEDTLITPTGEQRIFESIKVPMLVDGEVKGLMGIARDITHRKELEEEIIHASKAKTAFIANMSHEIRTPMNSIVGFSELALEQEMSMKVRSYLVRITESSNWLLQIINDILDVSKIESGKLELEHSPFRLSDVFDNCKSITHVKAVEKGIKLHFYAEPSPANEVLVGDAFRLRQVFINLLTNAVKFTSEGIIRVSAIITETTESTQTIRCSIQDTGIGMTPEQIARATEPFMQADVSITRKFGGTGLGLPIVTRLIEKMGGELKIESELGKGSIFSFELTFSTIASSLEQHFDKSNLRDMCKPTFTGEILVCEDNNMNQMVITEHLSRVGLETEIAENGQIGVDKIRERMKNKGNNKPYDLILMDIHMPTMDGIDAASKILAMGCTTPIVALTANVMATDREAYKQYGMVDCIGKPFTSQELWRCLAKYLDTISCTAEEDSTESLLENKNDDEYQLIQKLKESFVRENINKYDEIVESLESGQIVLAHRLVHTLKSSAGLIGKQDLQDISAQIEDLLRDNAEVPLEHLTTLQKELIAVLSELAQFIGNKEEQPKTINDPAKVRALFVKLEPLIKSRNPESLDLLNEIKAVPGADELARQIESYDFKPAMQTIERLKEVWRLI
ncbi:MAG: ATP-binding protein [Defluviitaleaceae bacterium]|nr:ATP-binding protein [Defluviitaleaceae bacterium]